METYYQLHREEILRKARERRLRKLAEKPQEDELRDEIKKLQSKITKLEEKVDYFKNLAHHYRQQRMDANEKIKILKTNQRTLSAAKRKQVIQQIERLEAFIQKDGSSRKLNTLRREKIVELKRSLRR